MSGALFTATGWHVAREFYYNDAGAQITNLPCRQARCGNIEPDDPRWPADGYRGDYIKDVAQAFRRRKRARRRSRRARKRR
jgi:arginyl-tRNA synthetase